MKRKLTTIFCADMQGYGARMAEDETTTFERLSRYREIMDQLFEKHDGRKVNTWGDAVIAEFTSVVEAVRCAVEVQTAVNSENAGLPKAEQMQFRIGINMGDVMEENGDIYGDGVNIAARLEEMADPGGIMVSETVYDFTHKQLAFGYDYAGEQKTKSGEEPIQSYKVRIGGKNQPEEAEAFEPAAEEKKDDTDAAAPKKSLPQRIAIWVENFPNWFALQPKRVKFSVVMIGFFFAINLLFSGTATPWFIFPSLPFALTIIMSGRDK